MKTCFVFLTAIFITASAMGGVSLTCSVLDSNATVGYVYDGVDSRPRSFALTVEVSAGTIIQISNYKVGPSTAASPGYGIFPEEWGSPIEPIEGTGLGTNKIIVVLSSEYEGDVNRPANVGNLFTIKAANCGMMTVSPDTTYNSGVIGEDEINIPVSTLPRQLCPDCVKSTAWFYGDWVAFGKPRCWCYPRHCRGDADGLKQGSMQYTYVYTNDLLILMNGYSTAEPPKGSGIMKAGNICCDFSHSAQGILLTGYKRCYTDDLAILIKYYNKKEPPKGSGIPLCDSADYNYFITPP